MLGERRPPAPRAMLSCITTDALLERFDRVIDLRPHELTIEAFGDLDFKSPASEQQLVIHRGPRAWFDDALGFCQRSLSSYYDVNGDRRFAYRREVMAFARCLRPTRCAVDEFSSWLGGHISKLARPIGRAPRGRGQEALTLLDEWNEQLRLCATELEFVAAYWSTSA